MTRQGCERKAQSTAQAEPDGRKTAYLRRLLVAMIFLSLCYPAWAQDNQRQLKVEGRAMEPTLSDGATILISEKFDKIERGDIVVFWVPDDPSKSFIMRIIGLGGEVIRMDTHGKLFIKNDPIVEPYVSADRNRNPRIIPETYIKPHYYFVMGDNRDASNDSRAWGLVPEKYVWGKFVGRYKPIS